MIRLVKIKKVMVTMPTDGKNEARVALTRRRRAQETTGQAGNLSRFCTTVHVPCDPAAVLLTTYSGK